MIEFKQINKWFGNLHGLNGINLEIAKGGILVIFGPSGSGKSTLIRCISRLEPIQEGQIIVDGVPVHDKATNLTKLRVDIGFVFQQFLSPHDCPSECHAGAGKRPKDVHRGRGKDRRDARCHGQPDV